MTKAEGTTKYTVNMTLSYLGSGGAVREECMEHYLYEVKEYKTFKGAVEAMIKAKIAQFLGNHYGYKNVVKLATVTDASGEILISYTSKNIFESALEIAASVEAEVEAIADKWAARNAETVKAYEAKTARYVPAERHYLEACFKHWQYEKAEAEKAAIYAAIAAAVIEDVEANDDEEEEIRNTAPVTESDDEDDELDDARIDALAATKETTAIVAVAGTAKEIRYEVEYFAYKADGFARRYSTLDYTSRFADALALIQKDLEIRGEAENFGGATITRFTNGSGDVVAEIQREGTLEIYDEEEKISATSTETALAIYIPRLETTEAKTALELAEAEYHAAEDEMSKARKVEEQILSKCGERNAHLEELEKEFRRKESNFERATRPATQARLYSEMVNLRKQLAEAETAAQEANQFYNAFSRHYSRAYERQLKADRDFVTARNDAGLKYSAIVVFMCGGRKTHARANVATIAEAVAFIYRHADNNLCNWNIFTESVEGLTTKRGYVAEGYALNVETFERLIQSYDVHEEIPEAEIAQPSAKVPVHYDTPADEFAAIAFRAIHYFTLDDFTTPISELREFVKRTGYAPAQRELAEWVELAKAAGVEIPVETAEDGTTLFIKDYRPTYEQLGIKKEIKTWEAKYAEKDAWFWRGKSHCSQVCWYWYDRRAYYYNRASLDRDVPTEGRLFMKAASKYTIEGQILLAIRRITFDKGNPNGYYDSPEAALARLISEYPQVAAAVDLDNEFVAWCFNDYFPREKAIAALNGDLSQIPQKDPLASVDVEEYAVTPEAHDAAIEGEIENAIKATAEAVEAPAREPADIHFGWLVENLNYCGGLKTRKIHVVRTITVASVDEAREFITMKSDKHLAPLSVRERAYCGQKTEYHEYGDMTLNVREYTYSNDRYRRPIVFEIDDFNHGAGTFAEFYIDGEITVISVDASTDISAAEATPEANTVNLGNVMERVVIETPYGLIQPYFHPKGTSINEIRELDARDAEISKKIASLHQPRKFEIVELRDEVFRVDSGIRDILERRYAEIALANSYTTANGDIIFDVDLVARLVSADKIYTAAEELYSEKRYRKHIEKLTAIYKGTPAVTVEENTRRRSSTPTTVQGLELHNQRTLTRAQTRLFFEVD